MDLVISAKSDKPIYAQIYDRISAQIVNGELAANVCLPSIRIVAKELGISVITVKKAYEMLEYNGFLYTRAGIGCFVAEYADKRLEDKKTDLAEERLKKELGFYRGLGLSLDELLELVKKNY